jgi:hypothetical protein
LVSEFDPMVVRGSNVGTALFTIQGLIDI